MNRLIVATLIIAASLPAFAQLPEPPPLTPLLVPLSIWDLPGRFGSVWRSELVVTNPTEDHVILAPGEPWCVVTGCSGPFAGVEPGVTIFNGAGGGVGHVGSIWYVEKTYEPQISFFLRLWDSSRGGEDWGTAVPVIGEPEFLSGPTDLAGAPTGGGFRVTLRVYEPEPTNLASVRVMFYSLPSPSGGAADSFPRVLDLRGGWVESPFPSTPAYAEITDVVGTIPQLLAADRFGVRIEPLTEGMRYWAMLSITHNETQHVTLITPD